MEPISETARPTIETAREVGRGRIDKFLDTIAPLAAPDVLVQIGRNAVEDKATEIKDRVTDTVDRFLLRGYDSAGKLDAFYEKNSNEVKTRTTEFGRRSALLGLRPLAWAEEKWQTLCELPAQVGEFIGSKFEQIAKIPDSKIKGEQQRLRSEISEGKKTMPERLQAEQALVQNEILDLEQQLAGLRAKLEELPRLMEDRRKGEVRDIGREFKERTRSLFRARDAASEFAVKNREKAEEIREKVSKFRTIRNLIESLKA